jgi:GAF domain-containing protein
LHVDDAIDQLGNVLLADNSLETVLGLIVSLVTCAIQEVDATSLSVVRTGGLETTTVNSDSSQRLSQAQSRSGPALVAMQEQRPVEVPWATIAEHWPELAKAAADDRFVAVRAIPLRGGDRVLGALCVFTSHPAGFDDRTRRIAEAMADHSAVLVANAVSYAAAGLFNRHLSDALGSRDLIGQAEGVLMERHRVGPDQAFSALRRTSVRTHRTLRDVAHGIVRSTQVHGVADGLQAPSAPPTADDQVASRAEVS